jgi:hypothetical protein
MSIKRSIAPFPTMMIERSIAPVPKKMVGNVRSIAPFTPIQEAHKALPQSHCRKVLI